MDGAWCDAQATRLPGENEASVHGAAIAQLALAAASAMSSSSTSLRCCPDRDAGWSTASILSTSSSSGVRVLEGEHGVTHLRYRIRRPHGA